MANIAGTLLESTIGMEKVSVMTPRPTLIKPISPSRMALVVTSGKLGATNSVVANIPKFSWS